MIYGAGSEDVSPPSVSPKAKKSKPIGGRAAVLREYFTSHPKTKMHQVFSEDDRTILFIGMSRLIKRGISEEHIKQAIDSFYETTAGTVARPVLTFLKKEVQDKLLAANPIPIEYRPRILAFIANDYVRSDSLPPSDQPPWSSEHDEEIRHRCIVSERDGPTAKFEIIVEYL